MQAHVSCREATVADAPAVQDVATDCWEHDYPDALSPESIRQGVLEWYDTAQFRAATGTDNVTVLVAETDDVVAFSHAISGGEVGDILRLHVVPERRGEGVDGALLAETVDALVAAGAERIRAMVLAENDSGAAFYRAAGFDRVDEAETAIAGETHEEAVFERPVAGRGAE